MMGALLEVSKPYLLNHFIDHLSSGNVNQTTVLIIFTLFVATRIMLTFIWFFNNWIKAYTEPQLREHIRNTAFSIIQSHNIEYFSKNFSGQISIKIIDAADSASSIINSVGSIILYTLTIILTTLFVFTVTHVYFIITFFIWLFIYFIANVIGARKLYTRTADQVKSRSKLSGMLVDSIANHLSVKVFAAQKKKKNYFLTFTLKNVAKANEDTKPIPN